MLTPAEGERAPMWVNSIALLVSLLAGAIAFLPFAVHTSPWNAVTLRVPGDQGNWWHFLVGAPFFLAFPMIWLRLRSLFSERLSTSAGRRFIWIAIGLSTCGTVLVELPFLLRLGTLARMSVWRQLSFLSPAFGILIASAVVLLLRRHNMFPTRACLFGLDAAYLANAGLCLVVYAPTPDFGWYATMIIVWFMALEISWIFVWSFRMPTSDQRVRAAL